LQVNARGVPSVSQVQSLSNNISGMRRRALKDPFPDVNVLDLKNGPGGVMMAEKKGGVII